jgi:glycosyltransferase involved in cell wall biosynthesis
VHVLYLIPERFPTYRPDVAALFGKYLPRHGITVNLVARTAKEGGASDWTGGNSVLVPTTGRKVVDSARFLACQVRALATSSPKPDAVVVRDQPTVAALAWCICRLRRVPLAYWMSFPITDGYRLLTARRWREVGLARWLAAGARAWLGDVFLYRWVLRRAAHVFVQSDAMREALALQGIPEDHLTAVPMGVDMEALKTVATVAPVRPELHDREMLLYVGTLGAARRLDVMIKGFALALRKRPKLLLVVVGQEALPGEEAQLRRLSASLGLGGDIHWVGWRPAPEAIAYMRRSMIGLSLIPRGRLFDVSSPTKLVEYLAAGLPAIASDIPEQSLVASQSGAAIVVTMAPESIAQAILRLAGDPVERARMAAAGPDYIYRERSYALLAQRVAVRLQSLAVRTVDA